MTEKAASEYGVHGAKGAKESVSRIFKKQEQDMKLSKGTMTLSGSNRQKGLPYPPEKQMWLLLPILSGPFENGR